MNAGARFLKIMIFDPTMVLEAFWGSQGDPKSTQQEPQKAQRAPKKPPRAPKGTRRGPQEGSKSPPKQPKTAPTTSTLAAMTRCKNIEFYRGRRQRRVPVGRGISLRDRGSGFCERNRLSPHGPH